MERRQQQNQKNHQKRSRLINQKTFPFDFVSQEFEAAVIAACGLTFILVLHLLTSMFSVYYSALTLCSK